MNTKLTLRLDKQVITRIKNYTMKNNVSLSKFTEHVFRQILENSEDQSKNLTPIVNKYKGILKNKQVDEKNELADILIQKHS